MIWLWWIFGSLLLLASGYAALAWWMMVRVALYPPRRSPETHPDRFPAFPSDRPSEEITVISHDGLRLAGLFVPAAGAVAAPSIVLLHGIADCKEGLAGLAIALSDDSFNVLAMDLRAHGQSDGRMCTYGHQERRDVIAAVDWLAEHHPGPVGVYGLSLGAAIALLAAGDDNRIAAVAADGSYARLKEVIRDYSRRGGAIHAVHPPALATIRRRIGAELSVCDPIAAAARLQCPVLLIHGRADRHVRSSCAEELADTLGDRGQLWLVPRAIHSSSRAVAGDEYDRRLIDFFRTHLTAQADHAAAIRATGD